VTTDCNNPDASMRANAIAGAPQNPGLTISHADRAAGVRVDWSSLRGLKVGALTLAAGAVFLALFGSDLEERYGLGALFRLRGPVAPPSGIALVAIDRASAESLNLPFPPPWPRSVHANIVNALKERGAKAIVLDLYFDEDRNPGTVSENQAFAEALTEAGNAVLLQRMVRGIDASSDRDELINPDDALRRTAVAVAPLSRWPAISDRITPFSGPSAARSRQSPPSLSSCIVRPRRGLDRDPKRRESGATGFSSLEGHARGSGDDGIAPPAASSSPMPE